MQESVQNKFGKSSSTENTMGKDSIDKYELLRQMLVDKRLKAELKQTDVAAKLGKPQSYVSKIERGERGVDVVEFLEIAKAIGFEPFNFLQEFLEALNSKAKGSEHE